MFIQFYYYYRFIIILLFYYYFYYYFTYQGLVIIHVLEAKDLKSGDVNIMGKGKSDPYCTITSGIQRFLLLAKWIFISSSLSSFSVLMSGYYVKIVMNAMLVLCEFVSLITSGLMFFCRAIMLKSLLIWLLNDFNYVIKLFYYCELFALSHFYFS